MKILGIEFAPLNIPLERRLQTLAVLTWLGVNVVGYLMSWPFVILTLVFGYQWLRMLTIFYLLFFFYNRNSHLRGGRSRTLTKWMRSRSWWRYLADYFPVKLIKTVDLDPTRNYVFCCFPHGIFALGMGVAFSTTAAKSDELFPGLEFNIAVLDCHFMMPIYREYPLSQGSCGCSEESLKYLLSTKPNDAEGSSWTGRAVVLMVGGAAEAFKSKPGDYRIVLKRRKGFVRLALQHGTPLVPVFSFGETDYYDQLILPEGSILRMLQDLAKRITGIALTILKGRGIFQYTFGMVPNRTPINVVVGAPIQVPKIAEPTREQVNEYHRLFIEKIVELFDTHKGKYVENSENTSLIIDD